MQQKFLKEKLIWIVWPMNNKKPPKVINLGCRLNFFESEIIEGILNKGGHEKKIVVNTCAVTNSAVHKSIQEVKKLAKTFPSKEIVVTGCASQVNKDLFNDLKNVSMIIDNKFKTLDRAYDKSWDVNKEVKRYQFPKLSFLNLKRTRATVQIQQGCNHRCTFCIIPYGRGDSFSLPLGEISKRVDQVLGKGFTEIVLTGVDLTSYGDDLPGKPKLGSMLKKIFKLHPNLKRLRLSSIDPAEIDNDLLELIKFEKRLMPHIHLSVQSGDNLILKRMKRRHDREKVIEICREISDQRNEVTFGADFIVGFPTESDINFQNTLDLISICKFNNIHIFPFSPKNGTPASRMPLLDREIINIRANQARKHSENILENLMNQKLLKKEKILFENFKTSYTDTFYKVSLDPKNNSNKKPGLVYEVKLKSQVNGKFLAEF